MVHVQRVNVANAIPIPHLAFVFLFRLFFQIIFTYMYIGKSQEWQELFFILDPKQLSPNLVAPPAVHQPLQGVPAAAHVLQAPLLLQVRVVPQQLVQT